MCTSTLGRSSSASASSNSARRRATSVYLDGVFPSCQLRRASGSRCRIESVRFYLEVPDAARLRKGARRSLYVLGDGFPLILRSEGAFVSVVGTWSPNNMSTSFKKMTVGGLLLPSTQRSRTRGVK